MSAAPSDRLATGVLLFSASLWGLSWMPLKWFIAQGLSGPMVSLVSYGAVGLCALVFIWRERAAWRAHGGWLLALALVGGWANTSFVNALMVGDVVRVMFLFYLSPVWSVLGGWLFLKERIPPTRWAAVVAAIVGLWLVLGGPGAVDLSFSLSDGLALSAGLAFAGNNLLARAAQGVPLQSKTFAVFVGCGAISLAVTAALGQGVPALPAGVWLAVLAYGFVWLLLRHRHLAVRRDAPGKQPRRRDPAGRTGGGRAHRALVRRRDAHAHGLGRRHAHCRGRAGGSPGQPPNRPPTPNRPDRRMNR
ncbi:DMT family transporter [Hydrogenophaga sp. UC242_50]|uniref:DMT family transporter n=1 Tax=Hydrogenophaga sp. UC242_50 TaxID=3350169 RepID=UPI0036D29EB8